MPSVIHPETPADWYLLSQLVPIAGVEDEPGVLDECEIEVIEDRIEP